MRAPIHRAAERVCSRQPGFLHWAFSETHRLTTTMTKRVLIYLRSLLARVELPGRKVFAQLLAGGLDEPWVLPDALEVLGRGVAPDVLFSEHLSKVRPVLNAVDDVLKYLILPPGSVVGAEEPVPEGAFSLGHFSSRPPCTPCTPCTPRISRG